MARIKYYNPSTGQWETLTGVQIGYTGPQGATGPAGRSITVKGTLANTSLLPSTGNTAGDAYIISGNLYVWDGTAWNNVGAFQGPSGPTGPTGNQGTTGATGAVGQQGFTGAVGATGAQGLAGATGPAGSTGAAGAMGATGATGEQGSVGPQGFTGPAGTSVLILGTLSDESELPSIGNNPGDGYLINGELWVWSDSGWTNVGNIQGPTGAPGYVGSDGATGPTGPSGPAIFVGPDAPSGPSGAMLWFDTDDTDAITLPAGPTGPTGPAGATGAASTVPGATGATGAGATGATGAVGATGAAGPTGPGTTFVRVTVATATGTATKVGTTTGGSYTPATGDIIAVTYTNGTNIASATLNVDGSGAKNIYVGGAAATEIANYSVSGGTILYYYDGTRYNVLGSQRNSDLDTTYTEISEAEITAGTASTARATSGRREAFVQLGTKAIFAQSTAPSDTNKLWYDTTAGASGTYGNALTVGGYGASNTPTANTIIPLDSSGRQYWSSMPVGTIRQLGYAVRGDVATLTSGTVANTWYDVKDAANSANLTVTANTLESTVYVEVHASVWYGAAGYKYMRATIDGTITGISPDAMAATYLLDQVTAAGATFRFTSVTPGSHTFGLQLVNAATGGTNYRAVTIKVYEVKS